MDDVLGCCEDDMDIKAVELPIPSKPEDPVSDEDDAGEDELVEDAPSSEPTELKDPADEEETVDKDGTVAGVLLAGAKKLSLIHI